jgi:hypothetical protein
MDELNGRMMACQLLITGLIARVANDSPDPLRFLTDFRDEIKAVVKGVNIAGMENTERVRQSAQQTIDELFSLMKAPSSGWTIWYRKARFTGISRFYFRTITSLI